MLFDRYGVRRPTVALMGVGVVGGGLLSFTTNAFVAIAAQAGIGLGCAPVFMGLLNYVLGEGPGQRQTAAVATASAIGMAGALAAAWPLGRAAAVGWRMPMMAATAAMFTAALGVGLFVKQARRDTAAAVPTRQADAGRPAGLAGLWTLAPACLAMSVGGTFRVSWGGPYLADVFGFDLVARGNAMTLTSLAGAGVALSMPFLVRVGPAKPIALIWLSASALAASALAIGPDASSWLGVALISVLFSVGVIHPLIMSQARAVVPADKLGIALGLLNTLVFLGIDLANACFGVVASEGRRAHLAVQQIYAALFAGTALMLAIGATAYVFSPRTAQPRSSAERE